MPSAQPAEPHSRASAPSSRLLHESRARSASPLGVSPDQPRKFLRRVDDNRPCGRCPLSILEIVWTSPATHNTHFTRALAQAECTFNNLPPRASQWTVPERRVRQRPSRSERSATLAFLAAEQYAEMRMSRTRERMTFSAQAQAREGFGAR